MKVCHRCRKELDLQDRPGRAETCPHCRADLRCCLNCAFFDPAAYNACREPQAERVLEKDRGHFCDYFHFRDARAPSAPRDPKADARSRLEDLFKK